jgi:hypothetical protein
MNGMAGWSKIYKYNEEELPALFILALERRKRIV